MDQLNHCCVGFGQSNASVGESFTGSDELGPWYPFGGTVHLFGVGEGDGGGGFVWKAWFVTVTWSDSIMMDRSVRIFFEIQNIFKNPVQICANELIDRQRERIKPGKKVVIKYI